MQVQFACSVPVIHPRASRCRTEDWVEQALQFTQRKGCDVILDMVPAAPLAPKTLSLPRRG
jgi:NADPH:quinone reductase-like Zn-dependent oxidoreductase